jgi:glutamine---fructose-6-phosphate transaminase (isomerizing)
MSAASLLRAEMAEQPRVLGAIFTRRAEVADSLRRAGAVPRVGVMLVARGSSDNADVYGRYLLELATGLPAAIAPPSLYTRYDSQPLLDGWVAVALSQSGETPEIVATLRALRGCGARAVAVTNAVSSSLARESDVVVDLACGPERAVPATKTLTASLAAIAVLSGVWGRTLWTSDDEARAIGAVEAVLADEEAALPAAEAVLAAANVTYLGRGFTYPVALEGALKLRETTGRAAEGRSVADYLHGPVASARTGTHVVACAAVGPAARDVLAAAADVAARGASVSLVAPADLPGTSTQAPGPAVPPGLVEPLAVLPLTVRLQQIALLAALQAGLDPDAPFGLEKVTLTT